MRQRASQWASRLLSLLLMGCCTCLAAASSRTLLDAGATSNRTCVAFTPFRKSDYEFMKVLSTEKRASSFPSARRRGQAIAAPVSLTSTWTMESLNGTTYSSDDSEILTAFPSMSRRADDLYAHFFTAAVEVVTGIPDVSTVGESSKRPYYAIRKLCAPAACSALSVEEKSALEDRVTNARAVVACVDVGQLATTPVSMPLPFNYEPAPVATSLDNAIQTPGMSLWFSETAFEDRQKAQFDSPLSLEEIFIPIPPPPPAPAPVPAPGPALAPLAGPPVQAPKATKPLAAPTPVVQAPPPQPVIDGAPDVDVGFAVVSPRQQSQVLVNKWVIVSLSIGFVLVSVVLATVLLRFVRHRYRGSPGPTDQLMRSPKSGNVYNSQSSALVEIKTGSPTGGPGQGSPDANPKVVWGSPASAALSELMQRESSMTSMKSGDGRSISLNLGGNMAQRTRSSSGSVSLAYLGSLFGLSTHSNNPSMVGSSASGSVAGDRGDGDTSSQMASFSLALPTSKGLHNSGSTATLAGFLPGIGSATALSGSTGLSGSVALSGPVSPVPGGYLQAAGEIMMAGGQDAGDRMQASPPADPPREAGTASTSPRSKTHAADDSNKPGLGTVFEDSLDFKDLEHMLPGSDDLENDGVPQMLEALPAGGEHAQQPASGTLDSGVVGQSDSAGVRSEGSAQGGQEDVQELPVAVAECPMLGVDELEVLPAYMSSTAITQSQ